LRIKRWLPAIMALLMLCFCGCSGSGSQPAAEREKPVLAEDAEKESAPEETPVPSEPRAVPLAETSFHADLAEGNDSVQLDLSSTENGYIAISVHSDSRIKLQVSKGDDVYTYDIASDGKVSILPLQCGDGLYTIRVMENVVDSKYAEIYSTDCDVKLKDEFQPFIRTNDYASYSDGSKCVTLAAELAGGAHNTPEIVAAIFDYICANIVYDEEKAATVGSGYIPTPDNTLAEGKGICFDYASLAAAMLRSQGIPTKVIFGYVSPDDVYHAWNMFYTEETGWVTVEYEVQRNSWNRLDLTFSANGANAEFIGDGTNYADVYNY